jgi:hypothetical protein
MRTLNDDYEFNVLGVYNYKRPGQFAGYYQFIVENHDRIAGDLAEVGVYRGSSLLATALLLKELGSSKLVWGFDSFSGFPAYDAHDRLALFDELHARGSVTDQHYAAVRRNIELRQLVSSRSIDVANISSSGDFSDTSLELLQKKIDYLALDNVRLLVGDFASTMGGVGHNDGPASLSAALIDCDLYRSYQFALPYVWSRLGRGGYVHLDEYYSLKFPGARLACDEFFVDKRDRPQRHRLLPGEFERWFVRRIFG